MIKWWRFLRGDFADFACLLCFFQLVLRHHKLVLLAEQREILGGAKRVASRKCLLKAGLKIWVQVTDIILRNRHWHRFRTFIVVYFIFCLRIKIFINIRVGFFWNHFLLRFFIFFQLNPKYMYMYVCITCTVAPRRSCRINRAYFTDCHVSTLKRCYFSYKTM